MNQKLKELIKEYEVLEKEWNKLSWIHKPTKAQEKKLRENRKKQRKLTGLASGDLLEVSTLIKFTGRILEHLLK